MSGRFTSSWWFLCQFFRVLFHRHFYHKRRCIRCDKLREESA